MELYRSTHGPGWKSRTNWGTGDPCANKWFGVSCTNDRRGVVSSLYVRRRSNHVRVAHTHIETSISLPTSTHQELDRMFHRVLNNNQLRGTIPSSIGSLVNLQSLYVRPSISIIHCIECYQIAET